MKHSLRPWRFEIDSIGGPMIWSADGKMIGVTHTGPPPRVGGPIDPECEANTRLIVAAPELLAALRRIENGTINRSPNATYGGTKFGMMQRKEMQAIARAAIQKATNEAHA